MKHVFPCSILIAFLIILKAQAQVADKAAAMKIGYTSSDVVLGRLPESKAMQSQLETTRVQLEKAIDVSIKEFQGKVDIYQKTGAQMTEIIRADKEKELENLQTRIQDMRAKAQESLLIKQDQLMQPIILKVNTAIQEVGKENGYTYIFNMDGGQGTTPFILFTATNEHDVTNLVLKKLGVAPKP
ncbi:OmpH family outer membrane protein [Dyadobacter luticola]|uniref:OmpH family outer membrane protein n=1 Tax=Dyadobacter luticola TaxID=1979387 RepID=A0A5R9L597_9BACT|nr:OmpH family outer membrane protein [Dyadobacter luticola]TLV03435.1 OmpH family outer membrane protein [Dyadobacter luticola]